MEAIDLVEELGTNHPKGDATEREESKKKNDVKQATNEYNKWFVLISLGY